MKILPFKFGRQYHSKCSLAATIIVSAIGLAFQIAAAIEPSDHRDTIASTKTVRITADKMVAEIDAAEVVFFGNVQARQSGTVITANRLKIVYDSSAVGQKGNYPKAEAIRKIIASGRVKIVNDTIVAEGDSAEYTIKSSIFILTGNPCRVSRDGDLITGSKFTLQRTDGTLMVEGSGEDRVRAIIQP